MKSLKRIFVNAKLHILTTDSNVRKSYRTNCGVSSHLFEDTEFHFKEDPC